MELLALVFATGTVLSLGVMALVGVGMWTRRVRSPNTQELADLVTQQLRQEIRDAVARALEDRESELEELHERVDFAERLLAQRPPGGAAQATPPRE
jgi:hypothetical protein